MYSKFSTLHQLAGMVCACSSLKTLSFSGIKFSKRSAVLNSPRIPPLLCHLQIYSSELAVIANLLVSANPPPALSTLCIEMASIHENLIVGRILHAVSSSVEHLDLRIMNLFQKHEGG